MRAVIFANGALTNPEAVLDILLPEDLLLAANGGARHCLALQLTPAVIIGDCDSLNDQELKDLLADGALSDAELLRGPGEALVPGGRLEGLQCVEGRQAAGHGTPRDLDYLGQARESML